MVEKQTFLERKKGQSFAYFMDFLKLQFYLPPSVMVVVSISVVVVSVSDRVEDSVVVVE